MIELKDVTISFGRPQTNEDVEFVRVEIADNAARLRVMQLDIELQEFARMITGRSDVPVMRALYHGTDHVGKKRVAEPRRTLITATEVQEAGGSYPRKNLEKWLLDNRQEEGWYVDSYLGSQSSINHDPESGGAHLNYWVFKYVDYDA